MQKMRKGGHKKGASSCEKQDPVDILDEINRELAFLTEVLMLTVTAHRSHEMPTAIALPYVAGDMLDRLRRLKELSHQLFERCWRE